MDADIYQLKQKIESKLRKGAITSKVLLRRSRFIEEASTKSASFNDPMHFPFYYQLGSQVEATSLLQIGVNLGLQAACFAQGCSTLEQYLGFQESGPDHYPARLAKGNIKDHTKAIVDIHVGLISDPEFLYIADPTKWDVAVITEESSYERHRECLELVWSRMTLGGLIAVDYMDRHEASRRAFEDFCLVKNRDPVIVATRYGVGIVQK